MLIAFNVVLIAIAGLIAYWWGNQGLFSALLHLVCVIVAGAIALAFWEPLTVGLLLRGGFFDDYAWGVSLLGVFGVSLLVLRVVMDRIAPGNVNVPHWASLGFGSLVGAAAGVLTVGMLVIGAGHIQSDKKVLLTFDGWSRSSSQASKIIEREKLWIPFHTITADFYSRLSVTSLSTARPLRHYAPGLDQQATLMRDVFHKGRAKMTLQPDAASITGLFSADIGGTEAYWVSVDFGLGAIDFGDQMTMSPSQIRLIGAASGKTEAPVIHPVGWRQYSGCHAFDDTTHYITSEPGQEAAKVSIAFQPPAGFVPQFIQIRGTRFRLPGEVQAATRPLIQCASALMNVDVGPIVQGGQPIDGLITITNSIRPVSISTNLLPGTIEERDRYLVSGKATFNKGGFVTRQLRVEGIFEPTGTKVTRLDISRHKAADVFRFQGQVGGDEEMALVDSTGKEYTPIGYVHEHSEGVTIALEPTRRVRKLDEIPTLPTTGNQKLELLFYITEGVTITGFRFGDQEVGYANKLIEGRNRG